MTCIGCLLSTSFEFHPVHIGVFSTFIEMNSIQMKSYICAVEYSGAIKALLSSSRSVKDCVFTLQF